MLFIECETNCTKQVILCRLLLPLTCQELTILITDKDILCEHFHLVIAI